MSKEEVAARANGGNFFPQKDKKRHSHDRGDVLFKKQKLNDNTSRVTSQAKK